MSEEPSGTELSATEAREREEDDRALQLAAGAGIRALSISTPFAVGRVNAYLLEDDPLTLIDCGPNSASALEELELALASHGHSLSDIGLLIITHQHLDHFGLAAILARRSGAEVAALAGLDSYLRGYAQQVEWDDAFAVRTMLSHGIPADIVSTLRAVTATFRHWGAAVDVTRTLHDGEQLRLSDHTLRVLHRPGHSPSDTLFWDEEHSLLIGGDHLIRHVSSNPLIARPLGAVGQYEGPRPPALISYLASLARTRELDLGLVLAGHGRPIVDHRSLIDERLRMHERRAEKLYGLVGQQPGVTAHELAHQMWGNIAVTQAYLTLSEVLGHIDLLCRDGRVVEHDDAGVVRFSAA